MVESPAMKIVVVGPGAIGCLFAALLKEAGNDVTLLDKEPERARRISQTGIRIEGIGGARTVPIAAEADPSVIGAADFVCICVKSYDTLSAVKHALPLIGPRTAVVSLQNGLGNAEQIAGVAGAEKVICATTSQGSTSLGAGHVRHAGLAPTFVAPFTGSKRAAEFVKTLNKSGIEAQLLDNAAAMLWSKAVVNAAINPVTAIWKVPNGQVIERADLRKIAFDAAEEAENVARAKGVSLLFDKAAAEVESVCRKTRDNISSMLQDVRRGRRTEIDAINGVIVKEGRNLGMKAPVNEMLVERVMDIRGL